MVRLPPSRLAINPLLIEWAGYHAGGFAHRDLKSAFVAGHVYPMTMRVVTALRSRVPRGRSTASDRSNRSESLSPGTSELRVAIGAAIKKAQWAISAVTRGVESAGLRVITLQERAEVRGRTTHSSDGTGR